MDNLTRKTKASKATTKLPFTMQRGAYFTFSPVSNTHNNAI